MWNFFALVVADWSKPSRASSIYHQSCYLDNSTFRECHSLEQSFDQIYAMTCMANKSKKEVSPDGFKGMKMCLIFSKCNNQCSKKEFSTNDIAASSSAITRLKRLFCRWRRCWGRLFCSGFRGIDFHPSWWSGSSAIDGKDAVECHFKIGWWSIVCSSFGCISEWDVISCDDLPNTIWLANDSKSTTPISTATHVTV